VFRTLDSPEPRQERRVALSGAQQGPTGTTGEPETHLETEIRPYAPGAWVDHAKVKVGVEIPFTRHFYEYVPPRPLAEIDAELLAAEERLRELLAGLVR